jgi:uncharacterized damage-inducible protein DinB
MANPILSHVFAESGNTLNRVIDGFPDSAWDSRLTPSSKSAKVILGHLTMVYAAYIALLETGHVDWARYDPAEKSVDELIADLRETRRFAVDEANGSEMPLIHRGALEYVVMHEMYHIGQLALLRSEAQPEWNAEAIFTGWVTQL